MPFPAGLAGQKGGAYERLDIRDYKPQSQWEAYIKGVLNGSVIAGRYVRLACQRHVSDLKTGPARGLHFDTQKAAAACLFFPTVLRHSVGQWAGERFWLSDNQAFIVSQIFGWRRIDSEDGDIRRFRSAYITAARKWGKSSLCAGLALLLLTLDDPLEPGAQIYAVATKEDQAKIVFREASKMVRYSPTLTDILKPMQRSIVSLPGAPQPDSFFQFVGSDSDTSDGFNQHAAVLDELHAWQSHHQGLYDRMTTAGGSRRQPLTVIITTAGDDRSMIWEKRDAFAVNCLEAVDRGEAIADNHFAFVARLDEQDDPFDPQTWPKANPNMPVTPKAAYLQEQAEECRDDPLERRKFIRFHTNRRVSGAEQAIDPELWKSASGQLSDWAEAEYRGGGADFGGYDDLCATGEAARFPVGQDEEGKTVYRYEVRSRCWLVESTARKLDGDPWLSWLESGMLERTNLPIQAAEEHIRESTCQQWAYDPNNAAELGQRLVDDFGEDFAFRMPQLHSHYNEPIRQFVAALKDGRVTHDGHPILAWAMGNLQVKENSRGEYMPCRRSSRDKIDPAVAVLMAFRMAYFGAKQSEPMIW